MRRSSKKLTDGERRPCQRRLWRRGRPDLLVDRSRRLDRPRTGARSWVSLDDDATIHSWDRSAAWFVTGRDDRCPGHRWGPRILLATGQHRHVHRGQLRSWPPSRSGCGRRHRAASGRAPGPASFRAILDGFLVDLRQEPTSGPGTRPAHFMATEGNVLRQDGGAFPLDQQLANDADYGAGAPQAADARRDGSHPTRPVRARLVLRIRATRGHVHPAVDNGDAARHSMTSHRSSKTTSPDNGRPGTP